MDAIRNEESDTHIGANPSWVISGDQDMHTFENVTLTPSIDASAFGCWHGFITNGEIT
jgi:hypothetical protein